ncbi:chitin synthase-domain-containing protein, partial [Entophlyctis helioformis]
MQCLDGVFYIGNVDHRNDLKCLLTNYILLAASCVIVFVLAIKFVAALQLTPAPTPEDQEKFVICQVPCYTEDEHSLRRTIDSLAHLDYSDKRRLLFVICDGMIIGAGNDRPTPRIVLDILGVDPSVQAASVAFQSLGDGSKQLNYGKVYSGLYRTEGRAVPFVVVVKVGKPSERNRPGNRGKRDSQLILLQFLSRVHYTQPMNPLELEIHRHMSQIIGVDPFVYEYILMVDADTQVHVSALQQLVAQMVNDARIAGLCGETRISNERDSWVTMIQVYEYFISHHLAKAFESLFGSVTCLPGCFSMYRIRTPTSNKPVIISDRLLRDYAVNVVDTLHLKNLLHLGEDRYLTTLMMKHFPEMKTKYTSHALCETVAPDKWAVLLSQRRRWINSTVHNLAELLAIRDLCGACCFSMRFVVLLDLVATIIQPASLGYILYLVIESAMNKTTQIPLISLLMIASIYGLQIVLFLLKREIQNLGWMLAYLFAVPIFSFYLPIYAFWHMDDFSWGNTRLVIEQDGRRVQKEMDEAFDPALIPLMTWQEH